MKNLLFPKGARWWLYGQWYKISNDRLFRCNIHGEWVRSTMSKKDFDSALNSSRYDPCKDTVKFTEPIALPTSFILN